MCVVILFGVGSVAQKVFSASTAPDCTGSAAGSYLAINIGWALGVFFGILVSHRSGSHLNPAVTAALVFHGKCPASRAAPYVLAQLSGAFVGAAIVYAEYYSALTAYGGKCCDNGTQTYAIGPVCNIAGVWATYPQAFESTGAGFFDQVGTFSLLLN